MLSSSQSYSVLVLVVLWATNGLAAPPQAQQQGLRQKSAKPVSAQGKRTFASTCANCHGLDGRGGERAPNIAENLKVQKLSDAQIAHIIENGIPGAGMPAFHSLETADVQAVVGYLRTLQGTKQTVRLPGDPTRGETSFFGKAGCSGCHMVAGKGGFIATDLSVYGRTHTAEQIRGAITSAAPGSDRQARLVTATTRGGEKVAGRIRNEDNFSMQLQTLDGTFYSVTKSDLVGLEYSSQTLMPSDYGSTLSSAELDDLVSYLMKVANVRLGEAVVPSEFEDE
jgi:cytochrome c oxidase cbb3-type subunit 3